MATIFDFFANSETGKFSFGYEYVCVEPENQIGVNRHSAWELSYIIVGAGTRLIGNTTEPFDEGEIVLVPPNLPHCWHFSSGKTNRNGRIEEISIMFPADFPERCTKTFPEMRGIAERFSQITEARKLSAEKAARVSALLGAMREQTEIEQLANVLKLLAILAEDDAAAVCVGKSETENRARRRFRELKSYIICNYQKNISPTTAAAHLGMNKAAFHAFFKKAAGTTFVAYVNAFRIETACRLLRETALPIAEVARQTGFPNAPYFTRVFRSRKNCSPHAYRKSISRGS